jgi:hypothetical protein
VLNLSLGEAANAQTALATLFCLSSLQEHSMAIHDLLQIVAPPKVPRDVGTITDWRAREKALGLVFPQDLHDLCARYGSGRFGVIEIYNPWSPDYTASIGLTIDTYRIVKLDRGPAMPYSLYPERPGLFPAGGTLDGGKIFWLVDGPPDDWPLVLAESTPQWQQINLPITVLLAKPWQRSLRRFGGIEIG